MSVSISVNKFHSPLNNAQKALKNTEESHADEAADATILARLLSGNRAKLAKKLNNGNNQTAQRNGPKAVGQGTFRGAAGGVLGEVMNGKVPSTVDAANDCVDGILEPLCNPIHGECYKRNQADDGTAAAVRAIGTAVRIVGRWLPSNVDADHGGGEPGGKRRSQKTTDEADNVYMAVPLADVDAGAKHESREGNPRNPRPKGKGGEEGKDQEDDTGRPVLFVQIVDGSSKRKHQVENTSHPDESFGKGACKTEIAN